MTIKQFIEKAIEGGWESKISHGKDFSVGLDGEIFYTNLNENRVRTFGVGEILLDPKAWEAVGKVEFWGDTVEAKSGQAYKTRDYKEKMHRMIDALVEGKTIEEFIKTL